MDILSNGMALVLADASTDKIYTLSTGPIPELVNRSVCEACPANSSMAYNPTHVPYTTPGAVTDCYCLPGYEGEAGGPCTPCGIGFYSDMQSPNMTCTECSGGRATDRVASNSSNDCICPDNSIDNGNGCACFGGYERVGNTCEECREGMYANASLGATCQNCSYGTTMGPGKASADDCSCEYELTTTGEYKDNTAPYYAPDTGQPTCMCKPGYGLNDTTELCDVCPRGKYGDPAAGVHCQQCAFGTTPGPGATHADNCSCANVGANYVPYPSANPSQCACAAGYEQHAETGVCVECAQGKFSDGSVGATCQACPYGSTASTGATAVGECGCGEEYGVGFTKLSGYDKCKCENTEYPKQETTWVLRTATTNNRLDDGKVFISWEIEPTISYARDAVVSRDNKYVYVSDNIGNNIDSPLKRLEIEDRNIINKNDDEFRDYGLNSYNTITSPKYMGISADDQTLFFTDSAEKLWALKTSAFTDSSTGDERDWRWLGAFQPKCYNDEPTSILNFVVAKDGSYVLVWSRTADAGDVCMHFVSALDGTENHSKKLYWSASSPSQHTYFFSDYLSTTALTLSADGDSLYFAAKTDSSSNEYFIYTVNSCIKTNCENPPVALQWGTLSFQDVHSLEASENGEFLYVYYGPQSFGRSNFIAQINVTNPGGTCQSYPSSPASVSYPQSCLYTTGYMFSQSAVGFSAIAPNSEFLVTGRLRENGNRGTRMSIMETGPVSDHHTTYTCTACPAHATTKYYTLDDHYPTAGEFADCICGAGRYMANDQTCTTCPQPTNETDYYHFPICDGTDNRYKRCTGVAVANAEQTACVCPDGYDGTGAGVHLCQICTEGHEEGSGDGGCTEWAAGKFSAYNWTTFDLNEAVENATVVCSDVASHPNRYGHVHDCEYLEVLNSSDMGAKSIRQQLQTVGRHGIGKVTLRSGVLVKDEASLQGLATVSPTDMMQADVLLSGKGGSELDGAYHMHWSTDSDSDNLYFEGITNGAWFVLKFESTVAIDEIDLRFWDSSENANHADFSGLFRVSMDESDWQNYDKDSDPKQELRYLAVVVNSVSDYYSKNTGIDIDIGSKTLESIPVAHFNVRGRIRNQPLACQQCGIAQKSTLTKQSNCTTCPQFSYSDPSSGQACKDICWDGQEPNLADTGCQHCTSGHYSKQAVAFNPSQTVFFYPTANLAGYNVSSSSGHTLDTYLQNLAPPSGKVDLTLLPGGTDGVEHTADCSATQVFDGLCGVWVRVDLPGLVVPEAFVVSATYDAQTDTSSVLGEFQVLGSADGVQWDRFGTNVRDLTGLSFIGAYQHFALVIRKCMTHANACQLTEFQIVGTPKMEHATCTPCAAGTVAPGNAMYECQSCEKHKYAGETGLTACVACADNHVTTGTGSVWCVPCPNIRHNLTAEEITYYDSDMSGSDRPRCLCHASTYFNGTSCAPCEADHYCDGTTNDQRDCWTGSSSVSGQSTCICEVGYETVSPSASVPDPIWVLSQAPNYDPCSVVCSNVDPSIPWECDPEAQTAVDTPGEIDDIAKLLGFADGCDQNSGSSNHAGAPWIRIESNGNVNCRMFGGGGNSTCDSNLYGISSSVAVKHQPICRCRVNVNALQSMPTKCRQCASGRGDGSATQECTDCPAGKFSVSDDKDYTLGQAGTVCQPCTGNNYSTGGQSSCTPCPPGKEVTEDHTGCGCNEGRYVNATDQRCLDCPAGKFKETHIELEGIENCLDCSPGTFSLAGASSCTACAQGTYQDANTIASNGGAECEPCGRGKWQSEDGQTECFECGDTDESVNFADNATTFRQCDCGAGYKVKRESWNVETTYYLYPLKGTSDTNVGFKWRTSPDAPSRWHNFTLMQDSLDDSHYTTTLHWQDDEKEDNVRDEHPVRIVNGSVFALGLNPWSDPALKFPESTEDSTNRLTTVRIPSKFNGTLYLICVNHPGMGKTRIHITDNQYATASSCEACSANFFVREQYNATRLSDSGYHPTTCTPCTSHSISTVAAAACVCEPGYTGDADTGNCYACPPGSFKPANGSAACELCQPGHVQPLSAKTNCSQCAAGKYQPADNQTACLDCAAGFYQNATTLAYTGGRFCVGCAPGFIADDKGFSACSACQAGTYAADTNQTECVDCLPGFYQGLTAATECEACAPGFFAENSQAHACDACEAGTFAAGTNHTVCDACERGFFQGARNATRCEACAPGSIANATGLAACTNCSAGSFAAGEGNAACALCDPGFFQGRAGASGCHPCGNGSFAGANGSVACENCSAGSFALGLNHSVCDLCAPGSFQGQVAATGCVECVVGYYEDSHGSAACQPCAGGTFNNVTGGSNVSVCLDCPAGFKSTKSTASVNCTQCPEGETSSARATTCGTCPEGEYADGGDCRPCPVDAYCAGGVRFACGAHEWTQNTTRNVNITACVCVSRYYDNISQYTLDLDQTATLPTLRVARKRRTVIYNGKNVTVVITDIAHYNPPEVSTPGVTVFDDTDGTQPPKLYYYIKGDFQGFGEIHVVDDRCAPCLADTYCTGTDDLSADCPANTQSPPASNTVTDCVCRVGHFVDAGPAGQVNGTACVPCAPGDYKDFLGPTDCDQCPPDTFREASGAAALEDCTACMAHSETDPASSGGHASVLACMCESGFFHVNDTLCGRCRPGTFNPERSQTQCTNCSAGYASEDLNATTNATCQPCPADFYSYEGSRRCTPCGRHAVAPNASDSVLDCRCDRGFFGPDGGLCRGCRAGTFKDAVGPHNCTRCPAGTVSAARNATSNATCAACARDTYSDAGDTACSACPQHSATAGNRSAGRTACECVSGFEGEDGGPCAACPVGTFKSTRGSANCTQCPAGTASVALNATSNATCATCPAGFYALAGSANCTHCPANSDTLGNRSTSVTACLCDPGYTGNNGGPCQACRAGTFKPDAGNASCTLCPVGSASNATSATSNGTCGRCPGGSYAPEGSAVCASCPANSQSAGGSSGSEDACECSPGFSGANGQTCSSCPAGTFKDMPGSGNCTLCPAGTASAAENATSNATCGVCPVGTYAAPGSVACTPCPVHMSTHANGSTVVTDCRCVPGFTGDDGGPCAACPRGFFKPTLGNATCSQCHNFSETAQNASVHVAQCECLPGFAGDPATASTGNASCAACAHGTYKDLSGNVPCSACPAFAFSPRQATQRTNCTCERGYTGPDGGTCVACAVAEYKDRNGSAACTACPWNATSPAASVNFSACLCTPGFDGTNISGVGCVACAQGEYKQGTHNGGCIACPNFTSTLGEAAMSENSCLCVPGRFLSSLSAGGLGCVPCAQGSYKDVIDNGACEFCPAGSFAFTTGADNVSQCDCTPGYTSPQNLNGSDCAACGAGKFKNATGAQACFQCPQGTYTEIDARALVDVAQCQDCPEGLTSSPLQNGLGLNGSCLNECAVGLTGRPFDDDGCVPCEPGFFKGEPGEAACVPCEAGTFQSHTASSACVSCRAGTYNALAGSLAEGDCIPCGAGTYSTTPRAVSADVCLACPAGTFQPFLGQVSPLNCTACPPGTYSKTTAPGQFGTAEEVCQDCPAGTFQPRDGATLASNCTDCPAGTFAETLANTQLGDCELCPAGTFSEDVGQDNAATCETCPAGTYAETTGNTKAGNCTLCAAGTASAAVGADDPSACATCPIGTYALPSQTACVACSAEDATRGRIVQLPGAQGSASCESCPAGFAYFNDSRCERCGAGYYSAGTTERAAGAPCQKCPPGKVHNDTGVTEVAACAMCAAGTHANLPEAGTACVPCVAGTYLPNSAPPAQRAGAGNCLKCPADTFSTAVGATSVATCESCAVNFASEPGSDEPGDCTFMCPPGQTGPPGDCDVCPSGTFKATYGNDTCQACMGASAPEPVQTACVCNAGHRYVGALALVGTPDWFVDLDAYACEECPKGHHGAVDEDGVNVCEACDMGKYNDQTAVVDASGCRACPAGTNSYAGAGGADECQSVCDRGQTGAFHSCEPCAVDTFKTDIGPGACAACVATTAEDFPEAGAPRDRCHCRPGFAPSAGADSGLELSLAGDHDLYLGRTYVFVHDTTQTLQLQGLPADVQPYHHVHGDCDDQLQERCLTVTAVAMPRALEATVTGSYTVGGVNMGALRFRAQSRGHGATDTLDGQACARCPEGHYKSLAGNFACEACPRGTRYVSADAPTFAAACRPCEAGTYADFEGSLQCVTCPAGKWGTPAVSRGLAELVTCEDGWCHVACPAAEDLDLTYEDQMPTSATLRSCRRDCDGDLLCHGFYFDSVSLACRLTYHRLPSRPDQPNPAAATARCEYRGTLTRASVDEGCTDCPMGKFALTANIRTSPTQCSDCAAGTYSTDVGATGPHVCEDCPAGTYSEATGVVSSTGCEDCPAGTYMDETGSSDRELCKKCGAGTYSMTPGAPMSSGFCLQCPAGTFSGKRGVTHPDGCEDCPLGTYNTKTGSVSVEECDLCAPGSFGDTTGRSAPCEQQCLAGTFSDRAGLTAAEECQPCPVGQFGVGRGLTACTDCPQAHYNDQPGQDSADACQECPLGSFSLASGLHNASECQPCRAGTYGALSAATVCSLCPKGTFSGKLGLHNASQCENCPRGTFGQATGLVNASQCTACPVGEYDNGNNTIECVKCPIGTFKDVVGGKSAAACQPCPAGSFSNQTGVSDPACTPCPPNRFSADVGLTGAAQCETCPIGTYTPETGSVSADACRGCPANTFMEPAAEGANESSGVCLPCGANQASRQGAKEKDACQCVAGFINDFAGTLSCRVCPADSFCPGEDLQLACGEHKTSPPQSTSQDDCTCQTGYRLGANNECDGCAPGEVMDEATKTCGLCPAGFYCVDGVNLQRCPFRSTSLVGASTRGGCFCDAGWDGDLGVEGTGCTECDALATCRQTKKSVEVRVQVDDNIFAAPSLGDPDQIDFLAQQAWAATAGAAAQDVAPTTAVFSELRVSSRLKTDQDKTLTKDMLEDLQQVVKTEAGTDVQLEPLRVQANFTGLFLASQLNVDLPCMQSWANSVYDKLPMRLVDYMREELGVSPVSFTTPDDGGLVLSVTVEEAPGRPNDFLVAASFEPLDFIKYHVNQSEWSFANNNWIHDALATLDLKSLDECKDLTQEFELELDGGDVVDCRDAATGKCSPAALEVMLGFDLQRAPSCAHCFPGLPCEPLNQTTCRAVTPPPPTPGQRRLLQSCAGKEVYWVQAQVEGAPRFIKFVYDPADGNFRAQVDDSPDAYNTCVDFAQAAACDCTVARDGDGATTGAVVTGRFDLVQTTPAAQTEVEVDVDINGACAEAACMVHFTNDAYFDALIQGAFRQFELNPIETSKTVRATGFKFDVDNVTDTDAVSRLSSEVARNQDAVVQEFALVGLQTRGAVLTARSVRVECEANEVLSVAEERCVCNRFSVLENATGVCTKCEAGYYNDAASGACRLCPPNFYCPTAAAGMASEEGVLMPCPHGHTSIAARTHASECHRADATQLKFDLDVGHVEMNLQNLALRDPAAAIAEAIDTGGAGLYQARVQEYGFESYWRCPAGSGSPNLTQWVEGVGKNHLLAYTKHGPKATPNATDDSDFVLQTRIPMQHNRQRQALDDALVCPSTHEEIQFVRSVIKITARIQDVTQTVALFDPAFRAHVQTAIGRVYSMLDLTDFGGDLELKKFDQAHPDTLNCPLLQVEYLGACVCQENYAPDANRLDNCTACRAGTYRALGQPACVLCEEGFECPYKQPRRACTGGKVALVGSAFCGCPTAHYLYDGACFPCTALQKCDDEETSTNITLEYPPAVQADVATMYASTALADFAAQPCPGAFNAYGLVVEAFDGDVPASADAGGLVEQLRDVDPTSGGLFRIQRRDLAVACRVDMTVSGRIATDFLTKLLLQEAEVSSAVPRMRVVAHGGGAEIGLEFVYNVTAANASDVKDLHERFHSLDAAKFHNEENYLVHVNGVRTRVLANYTAGMPSLTFVPNKRIVDAVEKLNCSTRSPILRQCLRVPGGVQSADVARYLQNGVRVVDVRHGKSKIPTCQYQLRDQDGNCLCPDGYTRRLDHDKNEYVCNACDVGTHAVDSVRCVPCEENFYCDGTGVQTACPPHSFSQAGSDAPDDCECFGGFVQIHQGICDSCDLHELRGMAACQDDERMFSLLRTEVHGYAARFPGVQELYRAHQDMVWSEFTAGIRQYAHILLLRRGSDAVVAPRGVSVEYVVNHTYYTVGPDGAGVEVAANGDLCPPTETTTPEVQPPEHRFATVNCSLADAKSNADAAAARADVAAVLAGHDAIARGGGCQVHTAGRWPAQRVEAYCPRLTKTEAEEVHGKIQSAVQAEHQACADSLEVTLLERKSIEQNARCPLQDVCPNASTCALFGVHAVLEIAVSDRAVVDALAADMSNETEKMSAGLADAGPVQLRVGASAYGGRRRVSCASVLAGSFLVHGQCVCPAGRYKHGDECLPCPFNHWCRDNRKHACHQAAPVEFAEYMWTAQSECLCRTGFYGGGDACQRCPAGSYCPGSLDRTPVACPAQRPLSGVGATAETDCVDTQSSAELLVDVNMQRVWASGVFLSQLDVEQLAKEEFQAADAELRQVAGNVTVAFDVAHDDRTVALGDVWSSLDSLLTSKGGAMGDVNMVGLRCGNDTAVVKGPGQELSVDLAAGAPIEIMLEVTKQDLTERPYVSAIWVRRELLKSWEDILCDKDMMLQKCTKVDVVQRTVHTTSLNVSLNITAPGTHAWPVNGSAAPLTAKLNSMFARDADTAFTTHVEVGKIDPLRCAFGAFASGTKCECYPGYQCSVQEDQMKGCVNGTNVTCELKPSTGGGGGSGGSGGGSGGRRDGVHARDDSVVFTTCYILYVIFLLLLHTYVVFAYRGVRLRGSR